MFHTLLLFGMVSLTSAFAHASPFSEVLDLAKSYRKYANPIAGDTGKLSWRAEGKKAQVEFQALLAQKYPEYALAHFPIRNFAKLSPQTAPLIVDFLGDPAAHKMSRLVRSLNAVDIQFLRSATTENVPYAVGIKQLLFAAGQTLMGAHSIDYVAFYLLARKLEGESSPAVALAKDLMARRLAAYGDEVTALSRDPISVLLIAMDPKNGLDARWKQTLPYLEFIYGTLPEKTPLSPTNRKYVLNSATLSHYTDEVWAAIEALDAGSAQELGIEKSPAFYQYQWVRVIGAIYAKGGMDGQTCLNLIADQHESVSGLFDIIKTVIFDNPRLADSFAFARLMQKPSFSKFAQEHILMTAPAPVVHDPTYECPGNHLARVRPTVH